jgi:hypothetical protein
MRGGRDRIAFSVAGHSHLDTVQGVSSGNIPTRAKRMLNLHILAATQYSFRSQAMHNSHIFYPKMYGTDPGILTFPNKNM